MDPFLNGSQLVLKYCACSFSDSIAKLFNMNLIMSSLPTEPIFKQGNAINIQNNYVNPLLCFISKVRELTIFDKILPFLYSLLNRN